MSSEQVEILWANHRRDPKHAWEDTVIEVRWDANTQASYRLKPLSQEHVGEVAAFRQPIGSAYAAKPLSSVLRDQNDSFVIKLPLLDGLEDRLDAVGLAYQQEYDLRDRFPPGQPAVLPRLVPAVWDEYGESRHPYLNMANAGFRHGPSRIPCVIRQYVSGMSLEKWIKSQVRKAPPGTNSIFHGIDEPGVWFELASALFKTLAKLHRERATHGFLFPGNIILRPEAVDALAVRDSIPDDSIVFVNAAESNRTVYIEETKLTDDAKQFPVRRWYDSPDNVYSFSHCRNGWACFQLRLGSDYYSATDIFSLGVTLAYLATGVAAVASPFDYVQPWPGNRGWQIIRGAETRRRYQVMKAKLLDSLLTAAEDRERGKDLSIRKSKKELYEDALRQCEVILQCIRSRSDRRAISPHHALTVLRLFCPPGRREKSGNDLVHSVPAGDESFSRELISLASQINEEPGQSEEFTRKLLSLCNLSPSGDRAQVNQIPPAIVKLVSERMRSALERLSSLDCLPQQTELVPGRTWHAPCLRVTGSRTTLVDAFLTSLSALSETDEIFALTTPALWSDENFGPTSRVSSMLQLLRLKGVRLAWVLMVDDLFKPQTQRVLGFRCADDRKIAELRAASEEDERHKSARHGNHTDAKTRDDITYDGFYYVCLESAAYERVLREKKTFIGFRKATTASSSDNPLELHIAPDLGSRGGTLGALTFWMNPRRGKRLIKAFEEHRKLAVPVFNFERML